MILLGLGCGCGWLWGQGVDWDAKGRAAHEKGNYREAKAAFERAVQELEGRGKEQAVSLANLAQTLMELGDWRLAGEQLERARQLRPESAEVWWRLGQAQMMNGEREAARQSWGRVLQLTGDERLVAMCLAELSGDAREQRVWLERALKEVGKGVGRWRVMAKLAELEGKEKRWKEAVGWYGEVVAELEQWPGGRHPDLGVALARYGEVLRKAGQKAEARAVAERAREARSWQAWQANGNGDTVDWRELRRR